MLSIDGTEYGRLHFVGILGSGMSSLAQFLAWDGVIVSGSDRALTHESTAGARKKLEALGCTLFPQDGSGVHAALAGLVVSTAIEKDNPDIARARGMGVPVFHRSDILAAVANSRRSVAVAGTSGKSTVTALVYHMLRSCDMEPSMISGANLHSLVREGHIGNAAYGRSSLLVFEADESDGSITKYRPWLSVILNVSKDHREVDETLLLFGKLATQSTHTLVNCDDPVLAQVPASSTFGVGSGDFSASSTVLNASSAGVVVRDTEIAVQFPGKYMAANLLGALCVCSHLGCDIRRLARAAATYTGIERRFDRVQTTTGVTVIDDYAHNPRKIRAALSAAHDIAHRVIALYQPHGFGPTRFLLNDLISAFRDSLQASDLLVLLPVYYVGGTVDKNVSSQDIAAGLDGCSAEVTVVEERLRAANLVADFVSPGDAVISMGARDPSLPAFARELVNAINTRH